MSPPRVSVIMATYNGAATIAASVNSILSQVYADFELIIADDCSTDGTLAVLATYTDPRLRILRNETNLGVVGARNRLFAEARGEFIAMLDHDDISLPLRLRRQVDYLDAHPDTVLVGTGVHSFQDGEVIQVNRPDVTTPGLIRWMLLIANPLACSAIMFRGEAARRLPCFMRENFAYADDYDFYHRIAAFGHIARVDEVLTLYRLHASNTFKKFETKMAQNAARVLLPAYEKLFGDDALTAATLVVEHLSAGRPVSDAAALRRLCHVVERVTHHFFETEAPDDMTRAGIVRQAGILWQRLLQSTARQGSMSGGELLAWRPSFLPPATMMDRASLMLDRLPRAPARAAMRLLRAPPTAHTQPANLFDITYTPCAPQSDQPPALFVVVDTEAEFDWTKPFARELTAVSAMDDIERGQAIFDVYGLRPIYVIDYPVASQTKGFERLRAIQARDGCEIGVHLHPWTTPPFNEEISPQNSYPGNLPAALEEEKFLNLLAAIKANFGITPIFYKAGRYGFGPHTAAMLARNGIKIDLSIMPGTDLRRNSGPDFRPFRAGPYTIGDTGILTLPMTRASVGLVPRLAEIGAAVQDTKLGRKLHIPAALAALRLAETITLTPEGVTSAEQIRLIKALLRRGQKDFVLHYHSPSLSAGHTPYAPDAESALAIQQRLKDVCRYFFDEVGGIPGYPRDLLART